MPTLNSSARWPAFIIVLVATFAAFSWWSLDRAASDVSAVTDPDYYAHGLKYHSAGLDQHTATIMEWAITPRLSGRTLAVEVRDPAGTGIAGCRALLSFPNDRNGKAIAAPLTLADSGNGSYAVELPPGLPATVASTLTLSKDEATTQRQILINAGS